MLSMWVKQCYKPPMTGNGKHSAYKNAHDWGMAYCFTHIATRHSHDIECVYMIHERKVYQLYSLLQSRWDIIWYVDYCIYVHKSPPLIDFACLFLCIWLEEYSSQINQHHPLKANFSMFITSPTYTQTSPSLAWANVPYMLSLLLHAQWRS